MQKGSDDTDRNSNIPELTLTTFERPGHHYSRVVILASEWKAHVHIGALEVFGSWHRGVVTIIWRRRYRCHHISSDWARFKALLLLAYLATRLPDGGKVNLRCRGPGAIDPVLAEVTSILASHDSRIPAAAVHDFWIRAQRKIPALVAAEVFRVDPRRPVRIRR